MGLLNSVARQGRNGDTMVAHLTPGEVVIPKEVAALRPDLVAHVGNQIRSMGGNPNSIVAGAGRINPNTGIEEFATQEEVAAAYQNTLGRAPDAEGMAYWMGQSDLSGFSKAAAPEIASKVEQGYENNFGRKGETSGVNYWTDKANSGAFNSVNDLWATMAKTATGEDAKAKADSAQFGTAWRSDLDPNKDALTYDANKDQWNPIVKKTQPSTSSNYQYDFNSQVDPVTETIEGRIQKLLDANNPVIRQAGERAQAQFAQRGLLNSSMAIEAANEAMISKAIEIAGPDAQTYFQNRQNNVNWTNRAAQGQQQHDYNLATLDKQASLNKDTYAANSAVQQSNTLQSNYLQAVQNADQQMRQFIQAIQAADMPQEAKTAQIQNAQTMYQNTMSMIKSTYKNMPQWVSEWSNLDVSFA